MSDNTSSKPPAEPRERPDRPADPQGDWPKLPDTDSETATTVRAPLDAWQTVWSPIPDLPVPPEDNE